MHPIRWLKLHHGGILLALAALLAMSPLLAHASVFASSASLLQAIFQPPPLRLAWIPGLDPDAAGSTGPNSTSFTATVKASTAPEATCNPFLNISATTSSGAEVALCWLPVGQREYINTTNQVLYALTEERYSQQGYWERGSLEAYNTSRIALPPGWTLVYNGGGAQALFYPGSALGANYSSPLWLSLCINVSAEVQSSLSSITYGNLLVTVAAFYPNGTLAGYVSTNLAGWILFSFSLLSTSQCYTVAFNASDIGLPDQPGLYWLLVYLQLAFYNYGGIYSSDAYISNVHIYVDDVFLNISLSGKGFYLTSPLVYNTTPMEGFNVLTVPYTLGSLGALAIWHIGGLGQPLPDPVPVPDLLGAGIVGVYGYLGSTNSTRVELRLSYSNGAVNTTYPISLDIVDPPRHCHGKPLRLYRPEKLAEKDPLLGTVVVGEKKLLAQIGRSIARVGAGLALKPIQPSGSPQG